MLLIMWWAQSKSIFSFITNTHSSWNTEKAKLSFDSFVNNFVLETAFIKITPGIFLALVCSLLPGFYLKKGHGYWSNPPQAGELSRNLQELF